MMGDVFSTLTMAGAYSRAVQAAEESDRKRARQDPDRLREIEGPAERVGLLSRLRDLFGRRQATGAAQTPAE